MFSNLKKHFHGIPDQRPKVSHSSSPSPFFFALFSFLSGFATIDVERFQAGVGVHPVPRWDETVAAR